MAHSLFPLYEGAEERWAGTQEDWEGGVKACGVLCPTDSPSPHR